MGRILQFFLTLLGYLGYLRYIWTFLVWLFQGAWALLGRGRRFSRKHRKKLLIVLALLIVALLGYIGWRYWTEAKVADAQAQAKKAVAKAEAEMAQFDSALEDLAWFQAPYIEDIENGAAEAKPLIEKSAERFAKKPEGGWRQRIGHFNQTAEDAQAASEKLAQLQAELDQVWQRRDEAFEAQSKLEEEIGTLFADHNVVRVKCTEEVPRYPSRIADGLWHTEEELWAALRYFADRLTEAERFLPDLEDRSGSGDPASAIPILEDALSAIPADIQKCDQLLEQLEQLNAKYQETESLVLQCERTVVQLDADLTERKKRSICRFESVAPMLKSLVEKKQRARKLLTEVADGERVPDYFAAHDTAQEVLDGCEAAKSAMESEAALAQSVSEKLAELVGKHEAVDELLPQLKDRMETLRIYHNPQAWQSEAAGVAGFDAASYHEFAGRIVQVRQLLIGERQDLAEADRLAQTVLTELGQQTAGVRDFIDFVDSLESDRITYSKEYGKTKKLLEDEEKRVSPFRFFAPAQMAAHQEAVEAFLEGKDFGVKQLYTKALERVRSARFKAEGLGEEAKQAYDDKMAEKSKVS